MHVEHSIAEIIVDVHVPDVDRVFHYEIPVKLRSRLRIGHRVTVPFGRRPRVEGYVIGLRSESEWSQLRPVIDVLDPEPVLNSKMIDVARRMSAYYLCPLVQMIQCFIPPGARIRSSHTVRPKTQRIIHLVDRPNMNELERRAPKQAAIVRTLLAHDEPMPSSRLLSIADAPYSSLKALIEKGVVAASTRTARRDPFEYVAPKRSSFILNPHQQSALDVIKKRLDRCVGVPGEKQGTAPEDNVLLLQGVTGSGKTEVYMRAIDHALSLGKGTIFLVPEISLTPQMIHSFRSTFGADVALLHSRLSPGERYDEWHRVFVGDARVVIGARSGIFAPVQNLGMIIIDEEHEPSYKQNETPTYHAREVARVRADIEGALVVLGSATPDLVSRYEAEKRRSLMVLPERVEAKSLPETHVVDMRKELAAGNRSMFSRQLTEKLQTVFDRGEQALLFMNRRGFASFLLCRQCGHVPRCAMCEVSLTLHLPSSLRCHYCEATMHLPRTCPECQGPYLRPFGGGTQKIQAEFHRRFPEIKSLRMDVDTTRKKGAHAKMIAAFSQKEYDCLIGTQMVAKGLHFPGVTLVGVISADTSLFFPDYRSAERTFQLLMQVAGRAGRGDAPGKVFIQTYVPKHYAIRWAAAQDFEGFYADEAAFRERVGYPPFGSMARVVWSGPKEEVLKEEADRVRSMMESHPIDGMEMLEPTPCPISKIKDRYRYHAIMKGAPEAVRKAASMVKDHFESHRSDDFRFVLDVDPLSFM